MDVRPHLSALVVPFPFDALRVLGRAAWVENIGAHAVGRQEPGEMSPTLMAKRTSPATS